MDKARLDEILENNRAQPVGHGYIDIIVSRENYKNFVAELVANKFDIVSISWWEKCDNDRENEYGLGGPKSNFYDCWFSELSLAVDDIKLNKLLTTDNHINEIISKVETKTISFPNETLTFQTSNWLTPAFWLNVPKDWRNKYCT